MSPAATSGGQSTGHVHRRERVPKSKKIFSIALLDTPARRAGQSRRSFSTSAPFLDDGHVRWTVHRTWQRETCPRARAGAAGAELHRFLTLPGYPSHVPTAVVTGSGGLVGAESSARLCERGFDVLGIENDLRAQFFGAGASTARQTRKLVETHDTFH